MRSIRDRREQRRDGKMSKGSALGSPFIYRSSAGNGAEERKRVKRCSYREVGMDLREYDIMEDDNSGKE